jgi:Glyoxalase/Bleomycin resistance protein/Dioxygenase superfamily
MRQRILLLCLLIAAAPPVSFAQTGFVDVIDHIHLAAPDQAKAVDWYHTHFGATLTPEGPDRAMLGTTRLIFQKSEMPKASQGSVL